MFPRGEIDLPPGLDAPALRAGGLVPDGALCVFVSGSLVRGWEHARSDVDVYAVTAQPYSGPADELRSHPVDPSGVPVVVHPRGDTHWDVEMWLETQLDQLVARAAEAAADDGDLGPGALSFDELDVLYRLSVAVALDGDDWLARRQRALWDTGLHECLARAALADCRSHATDALGLVESGDAESAVVTARLALERLVDGLVSATGDFCPVAKWRARRMRAAAPEALPWDVYWPLETMRGYRDDDPGAWVRAVLGACDAALESATP